MTDNPQYDRVTCYFCLSEERQILEEHHIVPRRFDGSDDGENLVRLCPTCHQKLERLYDSRFYDELGVERPDSGDSTGAVAGTSMKGDVGPPGAAQALLDIIDEEDTDPRGAPLDVVLGRATSEFDISREEARLAIDMLRESGEVFKPYDGHRRTT